MPKASPFFSLVLIGPCGWLDSFFLHISPKDAYGVEMSVFQVGGKLFLVQGILLGKMRMRTVEKKQLQMLSNCEN